ncbi:MAG: 6-bladed beta-propeller [Rhodospirillaceae bacterium]|nr:6-bladed beta-propeller [Rhodospirillaceae bacterium]
MRIAAVIGMALALAAMPALAQGQKLSPEQQADTDALRALVKTIPDLPVERIELKLTPATTIYGISAMAGDAKGNVYIIHRPENKNVDPIVIADAKGNVLRSFGKGLFEIPHGIRVDPDGNVWAIDAHTSKIFKFTPEGKKLLEISVGDIPDATRPFCGATDVTFAKNGHIFASDGYCNGRVLEYTADGKKIREFGKRGKGRGEFMNAHDVSLSPDGKIFVADRENGRVQWFDMDGKYLGEKHFGGQLFAVAISSAGDVYVDAQPRDVPFGTDSHIIKFDPASGRIIGKIAATAHQLSVAPDGALMPGTRVPRSDSVLILRPKQ